MTRVLVTGARGFIGRATLAPLVDQGLEVHALTSSAGTPAPDTSPDVHWHRADLLANGAADQLLRQIKPSHLLHLAWYTEPGRFWGSTENLSWVEASVRLVRAFADYGGRRVVVAGSCAEYAWEEHTHCVEGRTPCRPATVYGAAKHGLHVIAERFAEEAGMSLAWGRVFFAFGPYESPARLAGFVARAVVLGQEAPCTDGEQVRDFLYSGDLAEAFVALLCSDVEGPVNLASGTATRVRDLIEALAAAAARPDLIRLGARPTPPSEPAELTADVTRLRAEVGWAPQATLDQRAADTIAWWRSELKLRAPRQGAA